MFSPASAAAVQIQTDPVQTQVYMNGKNIIVFFSFHNEI